MEPDYKVEITIAHVYINTVWFRGNLSIMSKQHDIRSMFGSTSSAGGGDSERRELEKDRRQAEKRKIQQKEYNAVTITVYVSVELYILPWSHANPSAYGYK